MVAPLIVGGAVAGIGGIGYLLFGGKKKPAAAVHPGSLGNGPIVVGKPGGGTAAPPSMPAIPLVTKPPSPIPVIMPPPAIVGTTTMGNVIHVIEPIDPDTGGPTTVYAIATQGVAIPQAHALYDYLVKNGPKEVSGGTLFKDLTAAFQTAHNTDAKAIDAAGGNPLAINGVYDGLTSATLTMYTGHPVSPAANVPPPAPETVADINDPNRTKPVQAPFAFSSANLYAYLKLHGNDKSATLKPLVKAFQHDVNTDPTYPGPVAYSGVKLIKTPITEDGLYGQGTYTALGYVTSDPPKP